ncbi:MAG: DUF2971 domain-containing protein, partial [Methylococcales bacterium]|nr:DUF2971 domain-containing protein [Methylococcales bacterium]
TSFCGEHPTNEYVNNNGLLSQWRGYGGSGGFAVVFNAKELEALLQLEARAFTYYYEALAGVVYDGDEINFEKTFFSHKVNLGELAQNLISAQQSGDIRRLENPKYFTSIFTCATSFKHRGFEEEREVRIISFPARQDVEDKSQSGEAVIEKERLFRNKNSARVPYIELFKSLDKPLPIEKIIVGPHKDKEARAAALKVELRNTNIDVVVSETPYIG